MRLYDARVQDEYPPMPVDWPALRREALSTIAKVAPRHLAFDGVKVTLRFRDDAHAFALRYVTPADWGALMLCLIELCDRAGIYWRVQAQKQERELNREAEERAGWMACTNTGWFTGPTAGEALLYAVATCNLALRLHAYDQMGML